MDLAIYSPVFWFIQSLETVYMVVVHADILMFVKMF